MLTPSLIRNALEPQRLPDPLTEQVTDQMERIHQDPVVRRGPHREVKVQVRLEELRRLFLGGFHIVQTFSDALQIFSAGAFGSEAGQLDLDQLTRLDQLLSLGFGAAGDRP